MALLRNIRKGFMYFRRDSGPSPEDLALLDRHLTAEERDLFAQMDPPDQVHSFRVARKCGESLEGFPELDHERMMRAALLHDVGKIGANLGLVFRTFWVLGHKVCPWVMDWVARRSEGARRGTLRQKMWHQLIHPQVGVDMLREMGAEEEVLRLVSYTGEELQPGDCIEKQILIGADADRVVASASR